MPLPDLHALEIAVAVITKGSMSGIAAQLGMTQSAVSQAVKRAEAQIGVTLLHRDKRPFMPTAAGRILALHMQEISTRATQAIEEVRAAARHPERENLRLGMIDTFASAVGPTLVRNLMKDAIALRVSAFSGLAHAHTDALIRHEIDAVITSDAREERDDLARFALFREPFVLVAPAARGDALLDMPLHEILSQNRLIRYSARSHMGSQIERHLRRLRIEHPQILSFDSSDSLLSMVAGGVGVAISTPLCLVQGAMHLPALAVTPLPGPGFSRELSLVTRHGELDALAPRIAQAIMEILETQIAPQIVAQIPWLEPLSKDMILRPFLGNEAQTS